MGKLCLSYILKFIIKLTPFKQNTMRVGRNLNDFTSNGLETYNIHRNEWMNEWMNECLTTPQHEKKEGKKYFN